jgi:hypothetical protein
MHCLNPTYDRLVILPPYNTIEAQLVKRGNPPSLITDAIIEYALVDNSYSYGKADYGQFWDNMNALFATSKSHDIGLADKGLSGTQESLQGIQLYGLMISSGRVAERKIDPPISSSLLKLIEKSR